MRIDRLAAIVEQIKNDPESWDQTVYHAPASLFPWGRVPTHQQGCKHCVAGWAQIHAGKVGVQQEIAAQWLELNYSEKMYLFSIHRTLKQLEEIVKQGKGS